MVDASRGERKSIPAGILLAQNSIGSPNTRASMPDARKCADEESPYGPAPTIMTSQSPETLIIPQFSLSTRSFLPIIACDIQ
jgi:hypothetical protein